MLRVNKKYRHSNKIRVKGDPLYNSFWFAKFVNKFMRDGKKTQVEKPIWKAFAQIKQKEKKLMTHLLFRALIKVRPLFGFLSKRLGRQIKIIPSPLFARRQTVVALSWYVVSVKLITLPSLHAKMKSALSVFPKKSNLFTILNSRRRQYEREIYKHRLNGRWRWK